MNSVLKTGLPAPNPWLQAGESLEIWHVAPELAVRCPHCLSTHQQNLAPQLYWELYGTSFTLLRCTDCQGQYTYPAPTPEMLSSLYKESFSYQWYRDHYPAKFLDALHRVIQYRSLGAIGRGTLLDYGGGIGYFAKALRLWGYQAETRDAMYESAEGAKLPVAEPRKYATITCHHVLEHALDPLSLLQDIRNLLQPDGTLILAVPNGSSLGYQRRGVHWVWSQPPLLHLHHITPVGLRALLTRAGFVLQKELFFERWDANVAADVKWGNRFARWDARWNTTPFKWGTAQLNSMLRFLSLAAAQVQSVSLPSDRSELLVMATLP